jgi:spermidine synthase
LAGAGRRVAIVDIEPMSFALARQYFNLADSIECHVGDGHAFLVTAPGSYDAIVLDAYEGNRIPTPLQSPDFFKLIRSRLGRQGVALVNVYVTDDADDAADRIANRLADAWPHVRILDTPGLQGRNAIVMAGEVSELTRPYVLVSPAIDANIIDSELAMMQFRARIIAP